MKTTARLAMCAAIAFAAGFAPPLRAVVNSRSYVQNGLVAQYDGINNAGHDAPHDPAALEWTDLTGNGYDGAVDAANVVWLDDGWTVEGDCKPITAGKLLYCRPVVIGRGLSRVTSNGNFTVQFACTPARTGMREAFVSQYSTNTVDGVRTKHTFAVEHNSGTLHDGNIRFYADRLGSEQICTGTPEGMALAARFAAVAVSLSNRQDVSFWLGGRNVANAAYSMQVPLNGDTVTVVGGEPHACDPASETVRDMGFRGKYNALRVYGRVLTAEENAINAAVDAIRYDGKVWEEDFPELAAKYFFDETGAMRSNFEIGSRSYISEGLVAHYDGIRNAGHAAGHDPSAAVWKDITGNGNDATVGAGVVWLDDGWSNGSDGFPMAVSSYGVSAVTAAGDFTMQFAVRPSRHNARQCFFGQYDSKGFSVEHNSSNGSPYTGFIRLHYYYVVRSPAGYSAADLPYDGVTVKKDEWASVSIMSGTERQSVCKNGDAASKVVKSNNIAPNVITNMCRSVIGGENYRESMAFRGTYNAFRLYGRILDDREVAFNSAVDAARFNGGAAMPAGYASADGVMTVEIAASAGEGGAVALAGGAYGARAAASVIQNLAPPNPVRAKNAETVAFSARAKAGFAFARWEGDTDAISSGSEAMPEIEVNANYPVNLTAVFKKKPGLVLMLFGE